MPTRNPMPVEPIDSSSGRSTSTLLQVCLMISVALIRRYSGSVPVTKLPARRRTQTSFWRSISMSIGYLRGHPHPVSYYTDAGHGLPSRFDLATGCVDNCPVRLRLGPCVSWLERCTWARSLEPGISGARRLGRERSLRASRRHLRRSPVKVPPATFVESALVRFRLEKIPEHQHFIIER